MPGTMTHSVKSSTLADVLERILDKGLVIAGDIKIKLVDIELLTIQIRLMIASVDKAREMGMDWWVDNPFLSASSRQRNGALTSTPASGPASGPASVSTPAALPVPPASVAAAAPPPADADTLAQQVAQLQAQLRELQARLPANGASASTGGDTGASAEPG